jgi:hypothetical protein
MLLVLQRGAVPVLEDLGQTLIVLLLKAVQLDDARVALEDPDLIAPGGTAPLRAGNVAMVECKGVAAARRFPAETRFREPTLAALLGEVKVDVVEALAEERILLAGKKACAGTDTRRKTGTMLTSPSYCVKATQLAGSAMFSGRVACDLLVGLDAA